MSKSGTATVRKQADTVQASPQIRILEVARELFCRNGIHSTGIDRILAEAGASKMTLYARYGSKESLLRAVLHEEGADWRMRFFARIEAAGPNAEAKLRAVIPALGDWFAAGRFYGCAFMNAVAEHPKTETWIRELAAAHHRQILERLGSLAAAAGYAEPAIVARQILLLVDGAIAALMVSADVAVLDIAARNLAAILQTAAHPAG
jgi:AcrR family transcriptional regulator